MNEKLCRIVAVCLVFVVIGLGGYSKHLAQRLEVEQAEHAKTRVELEHAVAQAEIWVAAYLEVMAGAEAQQKLAEACLARESETRADTEARKAILAPVKPRPRSPEEREKVVDNDTRTRVIDRLNRPL